MLGRQNDGRKRIDTKNSNIKQFFITLHKKKNANKTNVIE